MESEHKQLVKEFIDHYVNTGHKKQTAVKMACELKKFFSYLEEKDLRPEELRVREAQDYQGWLVEHGKLDGSPYKPGSVACLIKSTLAFYGFLKYKRIILSNPFNYIDKIKQPKTIPFNLLSEKHMSKLLEYFAHFDDGVCLRERIRKYKAHVITELMYSTAMRISEVAQLTVSDIDFNRAVVFVKNGKGCKPRECILNEYAKAVLSLYAEDFYPLILSGNHNKKLLFGAETDALCHMLNRELKQATEALGINNITSHGFRHSVGFHLLRAGCDIRYIQAILGHERLKNTEIYTRVDKRDLKEVLDKYHPRKMRSIKHETVKQ